jgi:serine/threonine protein kinase
LEDFEIMAMIGKGSISNVFLVKEKSSGNAFAMKSISKEFVIKD